MKKIILLTFAVFASLSLSAQQVSFDQSELNSFTASVNKFSEVQTVYVNASNFSTSDNMVLTAYGDFEYSFDQFTWKKTGSLCVCKATQTGSGTKYSLASTAVYVRFAPTIDGLASGYISANMRGYKAVLNLSGTAATATSTVNLNSVKAIAYPNPTKGNLRFDGIEKVTYDYSIVNNLGALVNTGKMNNNELDVNNLSNGIYTLFLNSGDKKLSVLFVKN